MATCQVVEAENKQFLDRLNARINQAVGDLKFIRRLTMLTSARNQYVGKVTRIRRGAVNDEVELTLAGGEHVIAAVTRESVKTLGLKVGIEAIALVKASWIILAQGGAGELKLSARNRLTGTMFCGVKLPSRSKPKSLAISDATSVCTLPAC